jgi:hypothetical protein
MLLKVALPALVILSLNSPAYATSITIPYTFAPNTTIVSSQVNANFSTIAGVVNGSLDHSNLSAGANISASQLNLTQSYLNLQSSSGVLGFGTGQTGDTKARVGQFSDGSIQWGPGGSTATDVGLTRTGTNTIQINDGTLNTSPGFLDFKYGTLLNTTFGLIPGGRLYLSSGNPYSDANGTGAVLYGPATSNTIVLYNSTTSSYQPITFSETSYSLSSLTASTVYDIYITYASSTSFTFSSTAWAGTTTPPTRGTDAYGRLTQNGSTAALLVGVVYLNGSKQTVDNPSERFVCNIYNTSVRTLYAQVPTSSWTYASATWRAADANTTDGQGRVTVVVANGQSQQTVDVAFVCGFNSGGANAACSAIGIDSTTAPYVSTVFGVGYNCNVTNITNRQTITAPTLTAGLHYFQMIESAPISTVTYYGNANAASSGDSNSWLSGTTIQ